MLHPMMLMNIVSKHEIKVVQECLVVMSLFDVSSISCLRNFGLIFGYFIAPPRFRLPLKYQDVLNYDKGEPIVIKIPYTGCPVPNVTLTKDGKDITKDKNVSVDVGDRAITLTIRNADKNTSGPYKIKLGNDLGEDEATLRIRVSGKIDSFIRIDRSIFFHRCSRCTT
jgi:hypothetical protein